MNHKKFCISAIVILFWSVSSFAIGTKDGGGGKGALCDGKLRTLEIYEASEVYHYAVIEKYPDLKTNIEIYASQMLHLLLEYPFDPTIPDNQSRVFDAVEREIFARFKDIPEGTHLPLSDDATPPLMPSQCKVVQIAYYDDKDQIIARDPEYWNLLSPFNQTALILHEAFYHSARTQNATTSDHTRQAIAAIMTEQPLEPMFKDIWHAPRRIWCGAGGGDGEQPQEIFEIYGVDQRQNSQSGLGLYFKILKGELRFLKTSVFIPELSIDRLMNKEHASFAATVLSKDGSWNLDLLLDDLDQLENGTFKNIRIRAYNKNSTQPPLSNGFCQVGVIQ